MSASITPNATTSAGTRSEANKTTAQPRMSRQTTASGVMRTRCARWRLVFLGRPVGH
jgi:hypothetical protein